jgi:hypothetical protein
MTHPPPSKVYMLNEITKFILKIIFFQNIGGAYVGERVDHFILRPPKQIAWWECLPTNYPSKNPLDSLIY